MNVTVTCFDNPFSFYCISDNKCDTLQVAINEPLQEVNSSSRSILTNMNHGDYVAVMWRNNWVRGVVTLEDQFSIWLVDYGRYIKVNESTVYMKLPLEYKKCPTKVFEASIHGVVPLSKVINQMCDIENIVAEKWSNAVVEKAKKSIGSSIKSYFIPIALLSYKDNDIVLGDLYLQLKSGVIVNLIDELELWPKFLHKNQDLYIKNLPIYYKTRRRHRACFLKPVFPNKVLPNLSLSVTLRQYIDICENIQPLKLSTEWDSSCEDGSTVLDIDGAYKKDVKLYKLTPEEIERCSMMTIEIGGVEHNVLQVLLNKIRDLNLCKKYENLNSVGRATSRRSSFF